MIIRTLFYALVLCIGIVLAPSFGLAATQGTLGATSQGVATINVTKSVQARISNISDMTAANWNVGDAAITLYSNVCVYSSTGSYKVTATGSGFLNAFAVTDGSASILYTVEWNDGGVGNLASSGSTLLTGFQSGTFTHPATDSSNCTGTVPGDTARVVVKFSQLAMSLAPSSNATYTGTLTMLITPI